MKQLVLASGNAGKLREIAALLDDLGYQLHAQSEFGVSEVAETGTTFVENAIIKARHAAQQTGIDKRKLTELEDFQIVQLADFRRQTRQPVAVQSQCFQVGQLADFGRQTS